MPLLAEFDLSDEVHDLIQGFIVQTVLSLYIVINPSGVSSVFLGLTKKSSRGERIGIAFRASVTGFIFLAAFALAGSYIFQALRITSSAMQIAGGIIVFGMASAMARGKESEFFGHLDDDHAEEKSRRSIAYTPLAVPLIAGPASITVVMTLSAAEAAQGFWGRTILLGAIAVVVFLTFLSMFRIVKLTERFGPGVALIMPRIMALVLAILAVKFFIDGVEAVMPELAKAWQKGLEPPT